MNLNCHRCGTAGHLARNCPYTEIDASGKPPWCGFCDERTRLIDHGDTVSRCLECHPSRRQQPRQHRKCPACHVTVYEWDNNPCGSHSGPDVPDRRPERQAIEKTVAAEMENAQ